MSLVLSQWVKLNLFNEKDRAISYKYSTTLNVKQVTFGDFFNFCMSLLFFITYRDL